jgi:hypothetical protein
MTTQLFLVQKERETITIRLGTEVVVTMPLGEWSKAISGRPVFLPVDDPPASEELLA